MHLQALTKPIRLLVKRSEGYRGSFLIQDTDAWCCLCRLLPLLAGALEGHKEAQKMENAVVFGLLIAGKL